MELDIAPEGVAVRVTEVAGDIGVLDHHQPARLDMAHHAGQRAGRIGEMGQQKARIDQVTQRVEDQTAEGGNERRHGGRL